MEFPMTMPLIGMTYLEVNGMICRVSKVPASQLPRSPVSEKRAKMSRSAFFPFGDIVRSEHEKHH